VGAAEKAAANLDAVPDHSTLAMFTNGRNRLNGAFEAVECVSRARGYQLETLVIFVTTNFAGCHRNISFASRSMQAHLSQLNAD
jgi:hypothetical protein